MMISVELTTKKMIYIDNKKSVCLCPGILSDLGALTETT